MYKPRFIANKKQLAKIAKYLYNVKNEMTHKVTQKVTHPQSVSKMLNILCILADHIATSQFATIKSQAAGVYMIWKKHKEDRDLHGNWLKLCYLLLIDYIYTLQFKY